MFARFRNFVYRHKRKLAFGGVLIGGAILALNYAHRKILEWQEKEALEFLKKSKKEQHFKSTERTCNQTIFSLSKALKETVFKALDSDVILQKIREGDGTRVKLWEELKVVVFAQICSLLYSGLMLVVLLRIQLNIIGGYMVCESSHKLSTSSQEKYLSLCQHFLEKSVTDLCSIMKKHSELILQNISLKQKLTLQDIENILWRFESSLNDSHDNPIKDLGKYLVPDRNGNGNSVDTELLRNVVGETIDILQNQEIIAVAESSLKRAFSNTVDKLAEYYVPPENLPSTSTGIRGTGESSVKIVNVTDITVPVAKLVPILHGLYRTPMENGSPDPWIEQFVMMEQLSSLGASIFEVYSSEEVI